MTVDVFDISHGMKLLGFDEHSYAWQDQVNGSVWLLSTKKGVLPQEVTDSEQLVGTATWGELHWTNKLTIAAAIHDNMFNHWQFFLDRGWTVEMMNAYFLKLCDSILDEMRAQHVSIVKIYETWAEEKAAKALLNLLSDAAFQAHMLKSAGSINDDDPERAK